MYPRLIGNAISARLRFANRVSVCGILVLPVEDYSANGEQCLNCLSQCAPTAQITGGGRSHPSSCR